MDDEIERLAESMHVQNPVTLDGRVLDWSEVVSSHPDRSSMYREAARNRMRAEEAMKRLDEMPTGSRNASAS